MNDHSSPPQAKPVPDPHLQEIQLSTQQVLDGHFLKVQRDEVRLPSGAQTVREYIVHPGAVMIVALLPDGRLVMERQFRYPVGQVMIEFPAGKLDPGEDTWACARRELWEETGYRAGRWARAGVLHPVIAYATEVIEIWFAQDLVAGTRSLDEGEFLDVFAASQAELETWVQTGALTDAKTMVGLLWLNQWRQGSWPLTWQSWSPDVQAPKES